MDRKAICQKAKEPIFSVYCILTPTLIFALFISMTMFVSGDLFAPERLVITKVKVDNTNPLTLSLTMKSFYIYNIYFDKAYIKDEYQLPLPTPVEIKAEWITVQENEGAPYETMDFLGQLPGGSEKVITLNFDTTLPSGNYAVWLHTYRTTQTFASPNFAVP